jgi:hypothetical protein
MAHSKTGLLGAFSGKVSELVLYELYGKMIVRRKPTVKMPKATGAKKQSQEAFKETMRLMQAAGSFIRLGFSDVAAGRSAFHTAMSVNLQRRREAADPADHRWLQLSQGGRAGCTGLQLQQQDEKTVTLTWTGQAEGLPGQPYDKVLLMALNTTTFQDSWHMDKAIRSDGQATIPIPPVAPGQQLLVFIAFASIEGMAQKKDPRNISDSQVLLAPPTR